MGSASMGMQNRKTLTDPTQTGALTTGNEAVWTFDSHVMRCWITNRHATADIPYAVGRTVSDTDYDGIVPAGQTVEISFDGARSIKFVGTFNNSGGTYTLGTHIRVKGLMGL